MRKDASGRKQAQYGQAERLERDYTSSRMMTRMIWLFVIGCVAGFILETVFCFFNKGYIESRRGMIYGPFNQVYGFGVVAMVLMLSPLTDKRRGLLFVASALVGGAFEFLCSWAQERVLGTVSWDYTMDPLSIGGRTSLIFMLYWGIGGVALMRLIYPKVCDLLDRVPARSSHVLARCMAVFLAGNMILSLAAVHRWHAREQGIPPANEVAVYLDEKYPSERMAAIYPSMKTAQ